MFLVSQLRQGIKTKFKAFFELSITRWQNVCILTVMNKSLSKYPLVTWTFDMSFRNGYRIPGKLIWKWSWTRTLWRANISGADVIFTPAGWWKLWSRWTIKRNLLLCKYRKNPGYYSVYLCTQQDKHPLMSAWFNFSLKVNNLLPD